MSSKNITKRELDLLLLGKTGNGKSATGNTILGRRAFESCSATDSVTTSISSEVSENEKYIIKVVDGPGVGDTRLDTVAGMELVGNAMQTAIDMNVCGYHAFLIVVRYGARFDKGDMEAIKQLKSIFGNTFVRDYCIVILTHGDNFERDAKKRCLTFSQWLKEQGGVFKEIVQECNERVLLFDNSTEDKSKMSNQFDALLNMIEALRYQGNRYCGEHFHRAKADREKAMVAGKLPKIQDETMAETSLILQKLEAILNSDSKQDQLQSLLELQIRAAALCESIKAQDKGTGALNTLEKTVGAMKQTVDSEIHSCKLVIQEEQKFVAEKKKNEELKRQLLEEYEKLNEQMQREREDNREKISQTEKKHAELMHNKDKMSKESFDLLMKQMNSMQIEQKKELEQKEKENTDKINLILTQMQKLETERDKAADSSSKMREEIAKLRYSNAQALHEMKAQFQSMKNEIEILTAENARLKKRKCIIL